MRLVLLSLCVALVAACACPATGGDDAAGVRAAIERLIVAENARDLPGAMASYTDDVVWLPPEGGVLSGKDAVRAHCEQMFAAYAFDLQIEVVEAQATGAFGSAWGYLRGTLQPAGGGGAMTIDDKFLAVLRREGDVWRLSVLAWNALEHG